MRSIARLLAPIAALTLLAGCSPAAPAAAPATETLTIEHAQGTATVAADPDSVVVLDYAALDTLAALGLSDKVSATAQATLPASLDAYAGTPRVGTPQEPDLEAIAALDPDAIIISARSADKYAELNELAPTIDLTFRSTDPVQTLTNSVGTLGDLFGVRAEADAALAEVTGLIAQTKDAVATDTSALILLTTGGKVSAYGPGSRFGALVHDTLGVTAAAPDLQIDNHGQLVSFEFVAETNPGALLVIDRDAAIGQQGQSAQQVLDNALVRRTAAWTNGEVAYLDGASWYLVGYGLSNTKAMIGDVRDAVGA